MRKYREMGIPITLWGLALVASLLLTGCASPTDSPAPAEAGPVTESATPASLPEESSLEEPAAVETTSVETTAPEQASTQFSGATTKPTPRAELHATDPSQVTLATGKPQLVEFFAFW